MNQYFNYTLTQEVNGRIYTILIPVGSPWAEAIEVVKHFSTSMEEMAKEAERKAQESQQKSESVEVLEVSQEDV